MKKLILLLTIAIPIVLAAQADPGDLDWGVLLYRPVLTERYVSETRVDRVELDALAFSPNGFAFFLSTPDQTESWRRFRAEAISNEPEAHWVFNRADFCWSPAFGRLSTQTRLAWLNDSGPVADMEAQALLAEEILSYEDDRPTSRLRRLEIDLTSSRLKQTTRALKADKTALDASGILDLRLPDQRLEMEVHPFAVDGNTAFDGYLSRSHTLGLDELGFWGGIAEDAAAASVRLSRKIPLRYNLYLTVTNLPSVNAPTRFDQMKAQPFMALDAPVLPLLRPVDAHVALEYQGFLTLGLDGGFVLDRQAPLCGRRADSLYVFHPENQSVAAVTFSAGYHYGSASIENRTRFQSDDPGVDGLDRIPFLPALENLLVFSVAPSVWTASFSLDYLSDRRDERDLAMPDVLLLDVTLEVQPIAGFWAYGTARNLLDREYRAFTIAPVEGRTLGLGVRWRF
jgi:hypothetical protein